VLAGRDWDPLVAALDELTAAGDDHGVEICAENMTQRLPRLEELTELLDRTDISLTVDTGHARTNGRPDGAIARLLTENASRVSPVHLNDTRGPVDEHLPFGPGTVDFEKIIGAPPRRLGRDADARNQHVELRVRRLQRSATRRGPRSRAVVRSSRWLESGRSVVRDLVIRPSCILDGYQKLPFGARCRGRSAPGQRSGRVSPVRGMRSARE
jgi:hypothetical protein